jgi:hypothetical protein
MAKRGNSTREFKRLTREDIKTFDKAAKAVVLTAMERGGLGWVSNRGHAIINAPGGGTMSVARSIESAPHTRQNCEADLRRLFPQESLTKESKEAMHNDTLSVFSNAPLPAAINGNGAAAVTKSDLIECPAKGCDREFATLDALYGHAGNEHILCKWPACDLGPGGRMFIAPNNQSLAGHTNIQHKGNKPWEHIDPTKRVATAKKAAATRARIAVKAGTTVGQHKVSVTKRTDGVLVADTPKKPEPAKQVPVVAPKSTERPEHRALPTGEKTAPVTDAAKLQAIRDLLGEDPRIALLQAANVKLQAKVDDLQAQLDLVAEALHLDGRPAKKK